MRKKERQSAVRERRIAVTPRRKVENNKLSPLVADPARLSVEPYNRLRVTFSTRGPKQREREKAFRHPPPAPSPKTANSAAVIGDNFCLCRPFKLSDRNTRIYTRIQSITRGEIIPRETGAAGRGRGVLARTGNIVDYGPSGFYPSGNTPGTNAGNTRSWECADDVR